MDSVASLAEWLRAKHENDVPIPCRNKRPLHAHAGGRWGWADFHAKARGSLRDVGILLHNLCVVDVDDADVAAALEARFPVLASTPRARTRKGVHYYFARSALADLDGYYDARSPPIDRVDFKTRCSNGTRGLILVPPSSDKTWILAPWETDAGDVRPIPDDLLEAVAAPSHRALDVRLVFVDDGGAALDVERNAWLPRCSYIEPLVDADGADGILAAGARLPIPCFSARTFGDLRRIMDEGRPTRLLTPADLSNVISLADFLGLPDALAARLTSVHHPSHFWAHMRDLAALDEAWARAVYEESATTTPLDVVVPLPYAPPRAPGTDPRWFLHTMDLPGVAPGSNVLHDTEDPAAHSWAQLPPWLRSFLEEHSSFIVAGGAALGYASPVVAGGDDIDIFATGSRSEAERGLWCALHTWPGARVAARTGNAVTVVVDETTVQFVLRLCDGVSAVLHAFDMDACKVALWWDVGAAGSRLAALPAWFYAMRHLAVHVDPVRCSPSYVPRLAKYYAKGFDVFVPGLLRGALLRRNLGWRLRRDASDPGLVNLFRVEADVRPALAWGTARPSRSSLAHSVRRVMRGALKVSAYEDGVGLAHASALAHALRRMLRAGSWAWGAGARPRRTRAPAPAQPDLLALSECELASQVQWTTEPFKRTRPFFKHVYSFDEYARLSSPLDAGPT